MKKSFRTFVAALALVAMTVPQLTFAADEPTPPVQQDNKVAIGAWLVSVAGVLGIGFGFLYAMPVVIVVMAFQPTESD